MSETCLSVPEELLAQPCALVARRLMLALLDEVEGAVARLESSARDDPEALHALRVGLRRLTATAKAWRRELRGAVGGSDRRALRALQRATGAARDADVALAWVAAERERLGSEHEAALDALARRFAAEGGDARRHARRLFAERFPRLAERLRGRLRVLHRTLHLDQPARRGEGPGGNAFAEHLYSAKQRLDAQLARVAENPVRAETHAARLCAKRLRYITEPLAELVPSAAKVLSALRGLQTLLGELNDVDGQSEALDELLEERSEAAQAVLDGAGAADDPEAVDAGGARSDGPTLTRSAPAHGLGGTEGETHGRVPREHVRTLRLLRARLLERRAELLDAVLAEWTAPATGPLALPLAELIWDVERPARPSVEIERKYLLSGRPALPLDARVLEIDQGYVPGERLHERLRRTRSEGATSYFRTVKLGRGATRIEIEEPTTAAVFDAMWPLTEGCRVTKRRHVVPDGARAWEIDEFVGRELWLAELELESETEPVVPPSWLAPFVVREVTDEPGFTNLELAR